MKTVNKTKFSLVGLCVLIAPSMVLANADLAKRDALTGPQAGSEMSQWHNAPLFASKQHGLVIADKANLSVLVPGQFEYLSLHNNIALTYDIHVDQVQGIALSNHEAKRLTSLPKRPFSVEWLCLQPREADNNLYAWIGSEEGQAEQWLLMSNNQWQPQLVRGLSVSMGAFKCVADDNSLYVIDNNVGLWRYPAAPNMPAESELITYLPDNELSGLTLQANQVLMNDESGQLINQQGKVIAKPFKNRQALENVFIDGNKVWAYSDDDDRFYQGKWKAKLLHTPTSQQSDLIAEVPTQVESDIADRAGDTMDDPAIWIHPTVPERSRVLGTNKRWGLLSFNMQGEQVQQLGVGRINNVDLRQGVMLGGKLRDIAVASNRDRNSLSLFEIDQQGDITALAEQPTALTDIYGLCLYQPTVDELYVFVNEKSGLIKQMALTWKQDHIVATEVAQLSVPSQPEGCVTDEAEQRLFVGEEDNGIWLFNLSSKQPQKSAKMVIKNGGPLVADIEGLALYLPKEGQHYLVVSSQGNDSYLLYNSQPPFAYVDHFRIGINAALGHDGSAETDGLEVTAHAVGSGMWAHGMMVVQDGRNRMPDQNQNFKWVPWQAIASELKL
jgi:3-phytase